MAKTKTLSSNETVDETNSETEKESATEQNNNEIGIPENECKTMLDISLVEARILVDCAFGKCNQIVSLWPEQAQQGLQANLLDTTPEAIVAAKSC